jgi:putative oxidoreductase
MLSPTAARRLETVGRWGLASLFILGGSHKLLDPATPLRMMDSVGLAPTAVLLPVIIVLQLGGGLLVAMGGRGAVPVAIGLATYTLATNFIFHHFWTFTGHEYEQEISLFFKNIAIAGGLFMIAGRLAGQKHSPRS